MAEEYDILIHGLKQGNKEVFDQIFRCYYASLSQFCRKFVYDKKIAEEIVQEMFVKLWLKHESIVVTNSLKSYLFKAARNHALNYLKHSKYTISSEEFDGLNVLENTDNSIDELDSTDLKHQIDTIVQLMPPKRRQIFLLSRTNGLKYGEIAERLNISVKTVESHMSKALDQLRKALQKHSILILLLSFIIK